MRDIIKNKKAFSLVEIIIYVALFSISMSAIFSYFLMINFVNNKNIVVSNIENNSRFIFSSLENKILDADQVDYPSVGEASTTLVISSSGDIYSFFESDGDLFIKKNNDIAENLNSSEVDIGDLKFFVTGNNKKNIKISFILESRVNNSRDFYYKKEYYNSFSIR